MEPMVENLKTEIQEAFSECYTFQEVAKLYFEIRTEIEKQLSYMNFQIAKEMKENGVFDNEDGGEE